MYDVFYEEKYFSLLTVDESLDARVTSLYERLSTSLTSSDDKGEGHTLTALSWVTKALVLRGHKLAQQFINLVSINISFHTIYV
jgi:hypothetical protein